MTTEVEQAFWELLRAGLWRRQPNMATQLTDGLWAEVIKHAKRQSLLGVLFDGMLQLPVDLQPKEDIRMKWFWKVTRIENANRKQNRVLIEIVTILNKKGVRALLLKGQSYAALYPEPLHRQCGDIDLYIGQKNYHKVREWAKEWGMIGDKNRENFHHQRITWQGINIDLHRVPIAIPNPWRYKRFLKWSKQMLENTQSHFTPTTEKEKIPIPELEFNIIFVFIHLLKHSLYEGVGLRQLCDWARMLHVYQSVINQEELRQNLDRYGLMHAWQVFGYILVHQMGLPQKELPFFIDTHKKSKKVLDDILEQGNFGYYAKLHLSNDPNYLARKRKNFFFHTKRYLKTMRLFPVLGLEAFGFFLLERGKHFFTDYFNAK